MKLINPLPPGASYVYHYTSAEKALNYILKNGTLRFNPFSEVNDPRENKAWDFAAVVPANPSLSPTEYEGISKKISDHLKANAKLVCFCRDKAEAIGKWQPWALLERGFAKPSMWHHYGDKHRGLCLMFDRNKLHEAFFKQLNGEHLISGEVQYSDGGIVLNLSKHPFVINLTQVTGPASYASTIESHLESWLPELFFRKLSDWRNEDEYRWIHWNETPGPIDVSFDDALEAIVIGDQVQGSLREEILKYCAKYHADVADLNWRNGYPKIENPGQPYITHKHLLDGK